MKILALLLIAGTMAPQVAAAENRCALLDASLIHCPAPGAPRVTELNDGQVVVRFVVCPDGSVAQASVVSSTGHRAWRASALEAVRDWRFTTSIHGFTKDVTLSFTVGGDTPPN